MERASTLYFALRNGVLPDIINPLCPPLLIVIGIVTLFFVASIDKSPEIKGTVCQLASEMNIKSGLSGRTQLSTPASTLRMPVFLKCEWSLGKFQILKLP